MADWRQRMRQYEGPSGPPQRDIWRRPAPCRGRAAAALAALLLLAPPADAAAADDAAGADTDAGAGTGAADPLDGAAPESAYARFESARVEVLRVHSGRILGLAGGREAVLPHVMARAGAAGAPRAAATRALADLALGKRLRLDLLRPAEDRYGRLRVRAVLPDGGDLAERLAALGVVRVMPEPDADPARIAALLARERIARVQKRGLWPYPYRVHAAEPYAGGLDRFEIVEGTVRRVSEVGRRRHLEFGADWRTDFTVGIPNRRRRDFADAGVDLDTLAGRTVRVRGWVRRWNGAFMELSEPGALELVGP